MDDQIPRRGDRTTARSRPRVAALVGAVLLVLGGLVGCSTVQAFTDLASELEGEGFSDVSVNVAGGDPVALTVSADSPAGTGTEEARDQAAEVVWDTFPRRLDEVRLTIDGEGGTLTAAELQERFGDRPAGLEEGDLGDDVNRVGVGVLVGLLLAGVLVVATAGVVALLVVRRRRRTAARPRPPWAPTGPVPPAAGTGPPPAGPVPPPGGWTPVGGPPPAPPTGPEGPPVTGAPVPPGAPSPTPDGPPPAPGDDAAAPGDAGAAPPAWWTQPRPTPPGTVHPPSRREARADARRRGRPVRGPRPPDSQLPPGWG